METKNIAKKLVAVMADCNHVAKNGQNSFYNYKYATAEDVLKKVNDALTKHRLSSVVIPKLEAMNDVTNLKGNIEHLATVSVQIHLIDSDSGESVDFFGIGSGQDAGDKAVMKAQTAAIKYAYMMTLCIATGDDPEADSRTDENTNTEKPIVTKANQAKRNVTSKTTTPREAVATCSHCGTVINSDKVVQYSVSKYGTPLCMECQKAVSSVA